MSQVSLSNSLKHAAHRLDLYGTADEHAADGHDVDCTAVKRAADGLDVDCTADQRVTDGLDMYSVRVPPLFILTDTSFDAFHWLLKKTIFFHCSPVFTWCTLYSTRKIISSS